MRYLDDGPPDEDVSQVFLPAKAAGVAMVLSSTASFVAVVFLARLTYAAQLETAHILLAAFTGVTYFVFVCTGLIIAYARFLPPPATRIWDLVRFVVSYLALLWVICFALSGALLGEVLLPLRSCTSPYPNLCPTLGPLATQTLAILSAALGASLAQCVLVALDLHATHPEARVVILRSELAARRAQRRRVAARMRAPLLGGGGGGGADEDESEQESGWSDAQRREASRSATVRAFLARARLPVGDPEAGRALFDPLPGVPLRTGGGTTLVPPSKKATDALSVPAMFSPDKRSHSHSRRAADEHETRHHRHQRDDDTDTDTDESTTSRSTVDSEDGTTTESSPEHRHHHDRDRDRSRAHHSQHSHAHHDPPPRHKHHKHPRDTDEEARRKRRQKKQDAAAAVANLDATKMEAGSMSASSG